METSKKGLFNMAGATIITLAFLLFLKSKSNSEVLGLDIFYGSMILIFLETIFSILGFLRSISLLYKTKCKNFTAILFAIFFGFFIYEIVGSFFSDTLLVKFFG